MPLSGEGTCNFHNSPFIKMFLLPDLQGIFHSCGFMQPADIYLIDEPSAYLDSEQRIMASKVIKRFIFHAKKTAFVVEHDFIMATYLADKVIVFDGKASVNCTANPPQSLLTGMNKFLSVFLKSYLLNKIVFISIG